MTEYYVERVYNSYILRKKDTLREKDTIIAVIDTDTNARKVCKLLNEQDERIKELGEENEKLKEIFIEQLENALTLSFVKEVYCNALLRILDQNDSVEKSKKLIKDYLVGDD